MSVPKTAEELRVHFSSLPAWDVTLDPVTDDDPRWFASVEDYGLKQLVRNKVHAELIRRVGWGLKHKHAHTVLLDSKLIKYTNQPKVRYDALMHYLDKRELFDKNSWFDTTVPVVTHWNDGYVVLDGTHRTVVAQLQNERINVQVVSQYLHGE